MGSDIVLGCIRRVGGVSFRVGCGIGAGFVGCVVPV